MSTKAEKNVYEPTEHDPGSEKMCFESYDSPAQFIYIPDMECDSQQALLSVANENDVLLQTQSIENIYPDITQSSDCYGDGMTTVVIGNQETPLKNTISTTPKLEQEWNEKEIYDSDMNAVLQNSEMAQLNENNAEDSDEETIATFMTASGQRLALYAVEDSDQVFAVAVYDESGAPPTNFQFLMKSDVERLIGEGAVRTVKKPTQIKKELVTEEPSSWQEPIEQPLTSTEIEIEKSSYQNEFSETSMKPDVIENSKNLEIPRDTPKESSLNERTKINNVQIKKEITLKKESKIDAQSFDQDIEELLGYDREANDGDVIIIERSTVNNLLMDNRSDEELTFADIQESLEKFAKKKVNSSNERLLGLREDLQDNSKITSENITNDSNEPSNIESEKKRDEKIIITPVKAQARIPKKMNLVRKAYLSSSLITRRDIGSSQKEENKPLPVEEALTKSDRIPETSSPKAKRPRKQQLTSVNRGDSEIIIQPATFPSEDEEVVRKRTYRRRRKTVRTVRYKMRNSVAKRLEKRRGRRPNAEKRKQYELIEIDVDEKDRLAAKEKSIVEITLDENNKEKGSSDKENEVIMVGDSDDEVETSTSMSGSSTATGRFECELCFRNFRQKRTLKMHLRVCSKSPKKPEKPKPSTRPSDSYPKKQFVCKICQEKFDVVVVLARHVKAMHSMKKRANARVETAESSTSARARKARSPSAEESDDGTESSRTGVSNSSMKTRTRTRIKRIRSRRRKRRKTGSADRPAGWKGQKLYCTECAKWFSSSALLASHALQHATKKSDKQLRRCQTCKKILKSRLLYIRHLRMHSKINNKLQKKLYHTRQTNADLATLRKRGRPRKL